MNALHKFMGRFVGLSKTIPTIQINDWD